MAKLQTGTRIYGTANVDTSITVGTSTITTGTGALLANVTTLFIGNNTSNAYLNTVGLNVNNATIANTTGFYTTGTVNAASFTVSTNFIANTSQLTTAIPISANGSVGTAGQILASNGSTGSPYWRNTVRLNSLTTATSVAIDASLYDMYSINALATSVTFTASTTGAIDGRKMMIKIRDNGTSQGITWASSGSGYFRPVGLTLPTVTTANKTIYIGCVYNVDANTSTNTNTPAWDVIAFSVEA